MTTYLGKSCSFCLPRVPFVDCRRFMCLVISLLVLRAGYGIWLYQFLIIAYLFTLISLFDTYVSPVLNYCSELWGYVKAQDIERVHTMFLKRLLGVKRSTSNPMVYCETGRLPLIVQRQFNMLKYWLTLQKSDNCVLKGLLWKLISCSIW